MGDREQGERAVGGAGTAEREHSVLVLNGGFRLTPALREALQDAFIIAADAGHRRLSQRGITPHVVVGDFDSSSPPEDLAVLTYPVEKDETDGELALRLALAQGARRITVVGAMGGRYDMSFGHVALLRQAVRGGAQALLTDGRQAALLVPRRKLPVGPRGRRISVIPLTPVARLASFGLRWPLDGVPLRWDEMRGHSNRVLDDGAWIQLVAGQALAVGPYPLPLA